MATATEYLPLTETITPATAADVAATVRDAAESGTPIYPIGGNTALTYGARPTVPGIGLQMTSQNRIIDHAADDLTITVEGGVTLSQLAEQLATRGQRLPIDVPHVAGATIAGVMATNTSGPRRFAHGTFRDYVIGLEVIDGHGTPFHGGGRVVKNAAGYDLCKMMLGSLGTLGVITQVTLMVRPAVASARLVVCEVPRLSNAERLLAGLIESKTRPVAVELLAGVTPRDATGELGVLDPLESPGAARLIVGFEGAADEVDWMVETLANEWNAMDAGAQLAMPDTHPQSVWNASLEGPADIQVNVRPSNVVEIVERMLALDSGCSIRAHAGNGIIRATFSLARTALAASLYDEIQHATDSVGGTMQILAPPDDLELSSEQVWGAPTSAMTVMRALKERFDPHAILNPGRFVFG